MQRFAVFLLGASALALASSAAAQDAAPPSTADGPAQPAQVDEEGAPIVVRGQRLEGSVIGDIPPEVTFGPADIRSFGVSSLSDLISELAAQTASGQGRGGESPVVLLGGKRVSSFAEIRDIPTEAIQRVEILPEEVALKYGYRPTQKVVNVVLRKRFNALTGELEAAAPTEGGQFSPEIDSSYLRIGDFGRLNLALKYQHSSPLYESERDLTAQAPRQPYDLAGNVTSATAGAEIDPALSALVGRAATVVGVQSSAATRMPALADFAARTVNATDTRPYRTLLPETDALTFNAVLARTIGSVAASFNGTLTYNESQSAQGLATAAIDLPGASPWSPFAGDTVLYRYLGDFGALGQRSRSVSGHLGTTLSGMAGSWLWSFTGNFDHAVSRTRTDRGFDLTDFQAGIDALDPALNPYGAIDRDTVTGVLTDRARSVSSTGNAELVMSGSLFQLPAGAISGTVKIGGTTSDLDSRSRRSGVPASADLSRDSASGQVSLDVPIASRKRGFLSPLGELSANVNYAYDRLSDFGGLRTIGVGVNWAPIKPLTLIASYSEDEGAPTVSQLGGALVSTTGVRVFDYVRGETVDITRLSGGNPALSSDNRRVYKLGATLKPITGTDLTFTANYTNSRVRDPIASFPTATAAIEDAFPERFTRDASGRLTQIDARPINFARQDQEDLRWGINFSKQLWAPPRPAGGPGRQGGERAPGQGEGQQPNLRELLPSAGATQATGSDRQGGEQRGGPDGGGPDGGGRGPGGGGPGGPGGGPPGGGFGRGPGGRGTRLQLAFYHTIHLRQSILVYANGPVLDLLKGDAIGSSGGQPRHELQVQAGLTHNGFGSRLSAGWQSATTVDGGTTGGETLRFSSLATINLRLFANLGQQQSLTTKWPFLRGSRMTLGVTNLLNTRQKVHDADGTTPISYQPAYLDPLGRSIRISFRKLFF
jgi:hypothetical protein